MPKEISSIYIICYLCSMGRIKEFFSYLWYQFVGLSLFLGLSRFVWLYLLLFWVVVVSWSGLFCFSCGSFYFWCPWWELVLEESVSPGWLALWVVGLAVVGLWSRFGWRSLVVEMFLSSRICEQGVTVHNSGYLEVVTRLVCACLLLARNEFMFFLLW